MKWVCLNCGRKNEQTDGYCTKCSMEQEAALSMQVDKRKRMCEECGHKHQEDVFCHVYCEAGGDMEGDEDLNVESDEEEEEEESDSDDDSREDIETRRMRHQMKLEASPKKAAKVLPLTTPAYIRKMGYVRCNCNVGIPNDSIKFEPLPRLVMVGRIQIQTYGDITDAFDRRMFQEQLKTRLSSETATAKKYDEDNTVISGLMPNILSNLRYVECAMAPIVSSYWNAGTNMYKEYVDVRNFVPWRVSFLRFDLKTVLLRLTFSTSYFPMKVLRPHAGQVDSILIKGNKVYSGGDRKVISSDFILGEVLGMVTRDSGEITKLFEKEFELFSCSSNGSIRTFAVTHTGLNMKTVFLFLFC
jgi:DNA-directed RNA polymerase subunit RPC12/RpoP